MAFATKEVVMIDIGVMMRAARAEKWKAPSIEDCSFVASKGAKVSRYRANDCVRCGVVNPAHKDTKPNSTIKLKERETPLFLLECGVVLADTNN